MPQPRVANWEETSDDVFGPPATEFFITWGKDLASAPGTYVPLATIQATGDLIAGAGVAGVQRLAAPTNSGDVLTVDTALPTRMKWAAPPGASGTLPADTVVVVGTRIISNKKLVGDAQPMWRVLGEGKFEWGPGGGGGLDTNLYRSSNNVLATDDDLVVRPSGVSVFIGDDSGFPSIVFGTSGSTKLYRAAADLLQTDDQFGVARSLATDVAYSSLVGAEGTRRFVQYADGKHEWGDGIAARDTNLYRVAANWLITDDTFQVLGTLYGNGIAVIGPGSTGVTLGSNMVGALSGLVIGADTNLYRAGAGQLASDGTIFAQYGSAGRIYLGSSSTTPTIIFGGAADTNLYRFAAGSLRTDGGFVAQGSLVAGWTGSAWGFTATSAGITFADGTIQSTAASAGGILVTALPGSPINGQEVTLTDSLTAPTYYWRVKYNSTTLKWHFIGGTPLTGFNAPLLQQGPITGGDWSGTWADVETTSAVTVPVAGEYDVRCDLWNLTGTTGSNGFYWAVSPKWGAATTQLADSLAARDAGLVDTYPERATRSFRQTLAAGAIIKFQYQVANRSASTADRRITVTPVKLG